MPHMKETNMATIQTLDRASEVGVSRQYAMICNTCLAMTAALLSSIARQSPAHLMDNSMNLRITGNTP